VKNEEELYRAKDKRDTVRTLKRRKSNWIGHILRRNRLLKHVTEGKIQRARRRRRRRRRKQLLDDLQEKRSYRNLEQEAPYRTPWKLVLEEAMDLSPDRQRKERMFCWMESTG